MALYTQTDSLQSYDAVEASGNGVIVPDAQLLFTADFSRAGSDLVLTGSDGAKFLVTGYFNTETPPSLISPQGAKLPGDVVTSLAGPQFPGQYAQASDAASGKQAIGKVESSSGSASAVRSDGTTVTLKAGDPVFQGDVVLTGPGSKLGISFVDGTIFSLTANARMVLNSLIYNPEGSDNSMLFSLVEGSFVFAAGQIAPTGDMKIQTPVATMGIRGTAPTVNINSETGEVNFSIIADPEDGHIGTYTLYNIDNGLPIGTVSSVGTKWQLTSADGQIIELEKTQDDLLNDANAVGLINNIYTQWQNSTQQNTEGPQAGPENNSPPSGGLNTNPSNPDAPGSDGNTGNTGNQGDGEGQNAPQNGNQQSNTPPPPPPTNTDNDPAPPPQQTQTEPTGPNIINGTEELDVLNGTSGDDIINGLGGNDLIIAKAGDDVVNAGDGNDTIVAGEGEGDDVYDGGAGNNTITYTSTSQGIVINLVDGTVTGPEIGFDTIVRLQNFVAGSGDDTLIIGEDSAITFDGLGGTDTIQFFGNLNIDTSTTLIEADNIETIDLNKTDENIFTISAGDVQNDDPSTILQIRGGTNADGTTDTVNLTNEMSFDDYEGDLAAYDGEYIGGGAHEGSWQKSEDTFTDEDGTVFDVYEFFSYGAGEPVATAHIEQGIDVNLPSQPTVMTFDGVSGSPGSYTEAGMTVSSLFGDGGGHLHLENNLLLNHSGGSSSPYRFQLAEGKEFDFIGFDVASNSGTGTWTSDKGGVVIADSIGTHHEFESNPLFQGVTWVQWSSSSGVTTIDNFTFAEYAPAGFMESFENGFEANGWEVINAAIASDNSTDGSFSAHLTTTTGNETDGEDEASGPGIPVRNNAAEIANLAGVDLDTLDSLADAPNDPGFATEGSAISTGFYGQAGQILSFNWFFSTNDYIDPDGGVLNDFAFFSIHGEVVKLFDVASSGNMMDETTTEGWNSFSTLLDEDGYYDIAFGVLDDDDSEVETSLNIDDIQLGSTGSAQPLVGGPGNDILIGNSDDNIIIGNGGRDTLTGNDGADIFVFGSLADGLDTITDFGSQDMLDLTGLLDGVFDPSRVNEFIQATTNGNDTIISVDLDGAGTQHDFVDIAILQGIGAGIGISVSIGDEDVSVTSAAVVV